MKTASFLVTMALVFGGAAARAEPPSAEDARPVEDALFAAEAALLAPGPGRELVARTCLVCHGAENIVVTGAGQDRRGWDKTVQRMIFSNRAQVGPEDVGPILDYLVTHYGPR